MNERFQQMLTWLQRLPELNGKSFSTPVPASSDASFRRYFRIEVENDENGRKPQSFIIMDAPTEYEDCRPFIKVANELQTLGLNVPKVIAQNLELGFLLLSDLGSTTYLSVLRKADDIKADVLYGDALNALTTMQSRGAEHSKNLPSYDAALLHTEMNLFSDWLLNTHLDIHLNSSEQSAWQTIQKQLSDSALKQPQTYVHRDYHSRNLMVVEEGNPGVLDFQDAVRGALTYDAVSLLRDCYIAWPQEQVTEWQRQYFLGLCEHQLVTKHEWDDFVKAMDFMGIQRHLKASGIFARLNHRDGKDGYLNDIPLTLQYIQMVGSHYSEMKPLVDLLEAKVLTKV